MFCGIGVVVFLFVALQHKEIMEVSKPTGMKPSPPCHADSKRMPTRSNGHSRRVRSHGHIRTCSTAFAVSSPDPEWIGYRRKEAVEPAGVPVLSSWRKRADSPVTPREAANAVNDAKNAYVGHGARIEYCISRGVDYDRSVRYLPVLERLERALEEVEPPSAFVARKVPPLKLLPPPKRREHAREETPDSAIPYVELMQGCFVRVRIYGMSEDQYNSIVDDGRCPLCGQHEHPIIMCPCMPNELRPFC